VLPEDRLRRFPAENSRQCRAERRIIVVEVAVMARI